MRARRQGSGVRGQGSVVRVVILAAIVVFLGAWGTTYGEGLKVGDEVVLMADGPGETMRSFPAVAFGKDVFLAVWQEGWQGKGGNSRIFAARVGLDGKRLDPKGIEIAPFNTGVQENPRVAFFRNTFVVVWQDMRNGRDCDVLAARISPDGKILDKQPIAIAAGARTQAVPDVAADDKGFMVVWHGFEGKEIYPKVFAARVGPDGSRSQPMAVASDSAAPRIVWNGREHLVIHAAGRGKTWLRMDTTRKVLPKPNVRPWQKGIQGHPRGSACGLADSEGWLMVYHGGQPNWWHRSVAIQRVVRITPDGKMEAPPGDNFSSYSPKNGVPVNWLDTSYGKKTQRNVCGSAHTPTVFPYGGSVLALNKQQCVAVWQRYHMGGASNLDLVNGDLLASRLDGWKPLDKPGVPVADSAAEELNPALAGNGKGRLLCVYEKIVDGATRICARTIETP